MLKTIKDIELYCLIPNKEESAETFKSLSNLYLAQDTRTLGFATFDKQPSSLS